MVRFTPVSCHFDCCDGGGGDDGGGCARWENDRMEGKGVHVDAEGSRYEGHFRANYRDGHGRCQWGNRHDTPFRRGFCNASFVVP